MAMLAYLDDGRSVSLNTEIGRGGEGAIYASPRDPLECAKIYIKPVSAESLKKLTLMVANPPPDPTYKLRMHRSICWPTAVLYTSPSKSVIAGFLMPKLDLKSFWKALLFIDPQDRTAKFGGGFTWKHLVTSATNIASAVAAIHEQGYCIGDLNESNILIAPNALASVIDCDSFQVRDSSAGKTYRSPVGKAEYTPPELIGKRLSDVDRTIASDSFALAVLLFQLLMEGTHPFQAKGRLVEDAPTTEAKILLGHFPYGLRGKEIAPPDHAPPFEILHPEIRKLFERCFKAGHPRPDQRPTVREWFSVLRGLESTFRQCEANANHLYFDHLRSCPWCELELRRGRDPFPSPVGQQVALDDSANLLDSLEKRLGYLHPYIAMAFADGVLTSEEESQLMALGKKLQIPPKEIEKAIQAEAVKVQGKRGKAPGSPEITVSRTSFEFNDIRQGTSLTGRYTITNSGGGTLTGAIRSNKPWVALPQGAIDASRHIQEHTFIVDTSKLNLGTRNHGAIEITSNAGSARIDISVSVELEKVALLRWRKQLFWAGMLFGLILGLGIYFLMPSAFSNSITRIAGIVGGIALVVVCAIGGKWGGGIGGFFLAWMIQAVLVRTTMLGYSAVAWAEIVSAFLFFWARPLLIARLAGNKNTRTWAAASGIIVVLILIGIGVAVQRNIPQPVNLRATLLPLEDKLAGSTVGEASGVQWANEIGNQGAVFSAANASRIEYPGIIPPEGTLEFWIKVNSGYHYQNFQLQTNQDSALIFSSDSQGGDVVWPGTTKLSVSRYGILSYWMATSKYNAPPSVATTTRRTRFRFGEWHAIGVSYGRQGQYLMLDGKIMASFPNRTQTFGVAGNHQQPLDIPTIGETVSHFWPHHRFEGGFEGVVAAFRVSAKQQDWLLSQGVKGGVAPDLTKKRENTPTSSASDDSLTTPRVSVKIEGDKDWTDTGVNLQLGDTIRISATGSVNVTSAGHIPEIPSMGPAGYVPDCAAANRAYGPFSQAAIQGFPAVALPCWSLIGRINAQGPVFEVGSGLTFTASEPGELYLGVNDEHVADNSGDWTASIRIGHRSDPGTIIVESATYGPSCQSQAGNDTKNLASQCNGRSRCSYEVSNTRPGGDPAPGCSKSYIAEYYCSGDPATLRRVSHDASKNEGYTITLECGKPYEEAVAAQVEKAAYENRICEDAEDGQPNENLVDHSTEEIAQFTVQLQPGCFSGYVLIPESWRTYRMAAIGPIANWWMAYKWYPKNSGSGQRDPITRREMSNLGMHTSQKIRVQGQGSLLFSRAQ
jgi:serine/threonine protein kinase